MVDIAEFHRKDCATLRLSRVMSGNIEPEATPDFVPMKEAIAKLGNAHHAGDWTGNELAKCNPPDLPDVMSTGASLLQFDAPNGDEPARWLQKPSPAALLYAERLLTALAPEAAPRCNMLLRYTAWPPTEPIFTIRQWSVAQTLAKQRKAILSEEHARLFVTERLFKRYCIEKRLRTVLRPMVGGDFTPELPWWAWNSENIWGRFHSYRMAPGDMFTPGNADAGTHWIFVSEADLSAIERELALKAAGTNRNGPDDLYFSPRLTCMFDTLKAMNIRADRMPKLEEIIAELPRHWPGEVPLSDNALLNMARILRDEDSRAGRSSRHEKARTQKRKS